MPHRGPDPEDLRQFGAGALPSLRAAVADVSWLLGRGYVESAAVRLAGDHYQLTERQRRAVGRASCSDQALAGRSARRIAIGEQPLAVDGFNVLIGVERGLAGGPVFRGRDGAIRDLAGIHGTFRVVEETPRAVAAIARAAGSAPLSWWLDRPVSNSGRLAALIREIAADRGLPWEVTVADGVDRHLATAGAAVATGDAWILDHCAAWADLCGAALAGSGWIVDLGG